MFGLSEVGPDTIGRHQLLVGAKTIVHWNDSLAALDRPLSDEDVCALEELVPADAIAGTRCGAEQMQHPGSER